jgi:hypothetical protein
MDGFQLLTAKLAPHPVGIFLEEVEEGEIHHRGLVALVVEQIQHHQQIQQRPVILILEVVELAWVELLQGGRQVTVDPELS